MPYVYGNTMTSIWTDFRTECLQGAVTADFVDRLKKAAVRTFSTTLSSNESLEAAVG